MQVVSVPVPAVTAGSASDFEYPLVTVPDLQALATATTLSSVPNNWIKIRTINLLPSAAMTGDDTNNFTLNFFLRRAGNLLVSTSSATTITAGTRAFTPADMTNIVPGSQLVFSGGTGAAETVTVQSTTATTATAVFANGHSGGYTIKSAPIASYAFTSGKNLVALKSLQIAPTKSNVMNQFRAGDMLTVQRISSNGTGLAMPAITNVQVSWTPARP